MTGLSFEPARWPCDICQWMPDFERLCQHIFIKWLTDGLVSICGRSYVILDISLHVLHIGRVYIDVKTKFLRMDTLPNFLSYGAMLTLARGAPLLEGKW